MAGAVVIDDGVRRPGRPPGRDFVLPGPRREVTQLANAFVVVDEILLSLVRG